MSHDNFLKNKSGTVINNNKSGLVAAKRRKRLSQAKDKQINDLEERLHILEDIILNKNKAGL